MAVNPDFDALATHRALANMADSKQPDSSFGALLKQCRDARYQPDGPDNFLDPAQTPF